MQEYQYRYEEGRVPESFKKIPFITAFLEEKHLKEVLESSRVRDYNPGEVIIPEGADDRWIFILLTGHVKVVKHGEAIATLDTVGDVMGEMAVINEEARSASVVAVTRTVCLAVNISFIDTLDVADRNACYAHIYRLLARVIAERLKRTSEELGRVKMELEALTAR